MANRYRSSTSGYIAFAIFLLSPLGCWLAPAVNATAGSRVVIPYWNNFLTLNMTILGVTFPQTTIEAREAFRAVFSDFSGALASSAKPAPSNRGRFRSR